MALVNLSPISDYYRNPSGRSDQIFGLGGNDRIRGEDGSDSLFGGAGDDLLIEVSDAAAVRNSLYGGDGNDSIFGNNWDDLIFGGTGRDVVVAEKGHDTIYGGYGADHISFFGQGSQVLGGEGNDTLRANFDGPANVIDGGGGTDRLEAFASGVLWNVGLTYKVIGGTLEVRRGTNLVQEMTGFEQFVVHGGSSDDRIGGSAAGDTLRGSGTGVFADQDTLTGNGGNDELHGARGDDVVFGGSGNDTITTGIGRDTVTGGTGADIFRFDEFFFSPDEGTANATRIVDLVRGEDRIDLRSLDANGNNAIFGQADAFKYIGTAAITGAGQLRVVSAGSNTIVTGSTDGDAAIDLRFILVGATGVTASDFIL